jgi:hypothetical protein
VSLVFCDLKKARLRRHFFVHGQSSIRFDHDKGLVDGLTVSLSTDEQELIHRWFKSIKPDLAKLGIRGKPPSGRRPLVIHFPLAELVETSQVLLPDLHRRARELDRPLRRKIIHEPRGQKGR